MRSRFHRAFSMTAILASVALVSVSLLATFIGNENFKHLVGWATIGAVTVGLPLAIWWRTSRASPRGGSGPERAESYVGQVLANEASANHSLIPDPAGGGHRANLRFDKVTSPFRDHGGGDTGDLGSIAEYFESLSPKRLVVLGAPGSGKTVLALELQTQLLRLSSQGQSVLLPALVNVASYDPGKTWASWLASQLAPRYRLPEEAVLRLVLDGRILPIIDGVDELERAGAAALMAELNVYIRERDSGRGDGDRPSMVLTCREAEYQDLAEPLDEATHIELRSLATGDVRNYLRASDIEIPDALASVLTNPLILSLASVTYGAGTNSGQPITDLLRLPDETAVERHLLAAFIANAYSQTGRGSRWSLEQAERWLAVIGNQMRALATAGYSWRQVAYAMPARLPGLLSGTATCLGLLVTFTVLGITHQVFGDRMPLMLAIDSMVEISLAWAIIAALLVEGANSGWLGSLPLIVSPRATTPLAATLSTSPVTLRQEFRSELLRQRHGEGSHAADPRADLSQSRKHALVRAALVGVTLGALAVAVHLVGGHVPRDATIVFVCYCMVVTILCSPWGSFQLARAWFSVRRELPYQLLDFLDDANKRGVLRYAGPRFEFRDYAVRGYFGDPARLPEVRQEIAELADWALGNPEIRESYRHVGADRSDIEQAIGSLATETIMAGRFFVVTAATRQAALERVRVRLNELGRRSAFEVSLVAREAPGLEAAIDPSRVILTGTMDDLTRQIVRTPSASVGISGIRGIGKSTLIRWLCTERDPGRKLPTLGIYLTAPVEYDARDFLVHLYITLCKAVLADDRFTDRRERRYRYLPRVILIVLLAIAGTGVYYHVAVDHEVTTIWVRDQSSLWSAAASALFTAALLVLILTIIELRRRGGRRRTRLKATARDRLHRLRYQVMETTGQTGNLTGPFGLSFSGSRSRQITENQMTLPELVESYREFAGLTVSALQKSVRYDGPLAIAQVRLVVGIDEIDRIEDAGNAEKFLNDIKAIFGVPNCFYVASLSADALANFERRVVNMRTAFDTTFDTVKRIGPLELETARRVLERRAIGLPYPFITLCYILSGGVPRELMRIARSIFDVRGDLRFESANEEDEGGIALKVIAPRVITREMDSLRQGLIPLATQLNVPGATELIGLLDDPDWPSGDVPNDLANLTKIISQRALFQDETSNITAAAKICDGLVAASYFFLSVIELFRTKLDQLIADLKRYDSTANQDTDATRTIHLLAKARTAIGVNPALAITRVQAARKEYDLPDLAPRLLSQVSIVDKSN